MQSATPFHTRHGIQETAESRKMQPLTEPRAGDQEEEEEEEEVQYDEGVTSETPLLHLLQMASSGDRPC